MRMINAVDIRRVAGGNQTLKAEAVTFTDIAAVAAVTGAEPVAVAAVCAAAAADTINYFEGG